MKYTIGLFVVCAVAGLCSCEPSNRERPSPLRADSVMKNNAWLKIEYSSPAVRERKIWGDLVPYGRIWRTGANQATLLSTETSIKLQGQNIDAGRYAVFTVPDSDTWEVILNSDFDQWGTYQYDSTLDVARFKVTPYTTRQMNERMKFYFEEDSLKFRWEKLGFSLAIE